MTALPSSGAFTMVDPTWVSAVGPAAAILYARILWRSQRDGEWRATRQDLTDETGLTPDVIRTATRVLRDREWVTTRRAGHFDAATVWTPVLAGQPDSGESPTSSDGDCPTSDEGISPISSLETVETKTLPPDGGLFDPPAEPPRTLRAVPSEADLDAEFAGFWESYPRKVGKKAARVRYGKVRRTTSVQVIAAALTAAKPSLLETKERDVKYVPHPASWLNGEPWLDGPQEAPAPVPLTTAELHGTPSPERLAEHEAWLAANPPRRTIFQ